MTLQKVERWSFIAFLITAPLQTRVFLASLGAGEWMSAWVWISDVALAALIFAWLAQRPGWQALLPLSVMAVFLPSLIANPEPIAFWKFGKLFEGLLLFSYVRHRWASIVTHLHRPQTLAAYAH